MKRKPVKRLRGGVLVEFDPQILAWRRWRKHKGACATKPKEKKAPRFFVRPIKNLFTTEKD